MQRRERKVAGLGDGERRGDRLEIAHFSNQDNVGVLAKAVLERRREGLRVGAHFALVDDAALVAVDELDRVLHRDDVTLPLLVDLVDDRRERGRFARARRARHQDQAARPLRQLRHHRREAELVEGADVEGNHADGHRHAAPLLVHVPAEAGQVLDAEGEVQLVLGLEPLLLVLGEHRVRERQRVLGIHDVGTRIRIRDVAVHAQLRPLTCGKVQVRGFPLDHLLKEHPEVDAHAAVSFTTSSSVVTPLATFTIPSMRRVSIPSATAASRSSEDASPRRIIRRNVADRFMTS